MNFRRKVPLKKGNWHIKILLKYFKPFFFFNFLVICLCIVTPRLGLIVQCTNFYANTTLLPLLTSHYFMIICAKLH